MSVPGGVAITLGGSKPTSENSRDGAPALDFSGAMLSALSGIGQGHVPADQRQFADLLGNRLKTEDVLQVGGLAVCSGSWQCLLFQQDVRAERCAGCPLTHTPPPLPLPLLRLSLQPCIETLFSHSV